jgi:hypothetical protein
MPGPKFKVETLARTIADDETFENVALGMLPFCTTGFHRNVLEILKLSNGLASMRPNAYSYLVCLWYRSEVINVRVAIGAFV